MFAITTRNKLHSRRHALSMIFAWARIRQQLARTPGMLAYTTGMANLTEFYTLTLWEKEIDMTLFMASDDHREMMWNARHWSQSFWSMRWNPTPDEIGDWCGKAFAADVGSAPAKPRYIGPGYLNPSEVPEKLRSVLRNITRQNEPETLPVNAVIGLIPMGSPMKLHLLRRVLHSWQSSRNVLYFKLCVGLGECLLLVVWKKNAEQEAPALLRALQDRFEEAWAMRFHATDFEIGHWNQIRFRELAAPGIAPASN